MPEQFERWDIVISQKNSTGATEASERYHLVKHDICFK